jgi:hypothetical protein
LRSKELERPLGRLDPEVVLSARDRGLDQKNREGNDGCREAVERLGCVDLVDSRSWKRLEPFKQCEYRLEIAESDDG